MHRALALALVAAAYIPIVSAQTAGATCDPAGDWSTDFRDMHLNATGATGHYEWDSGRITGSMSGLNLTGRWSEAPSYAPPGDAGDFIFRFDATCTYFQGQWRHDGDAPDAWGTWNGYRIGGGTPTPTPSAAPTPPPTPSAPAPPTPTPSAPTPGDFGDFLPEDNATADAPPACDMTGRWSTSMEIGTLSLSQQGTGIREGDAGGQVTEFRGTMRGHELRGALALRAGGKPRDFRVTLAQDCDSFTGTIYDGAGDDRAWNGTRELNEEDIARGAPAPGAALVLALVGALTILGRAGSRKR